MNTSEQPSPDTVLAKESERELALAVSERLTEAFSWERTPQGYDYWAEVTNNLRALAGEPPNVY